MAERNSNQAAKVVVESLRRDQVTFQGTVLSAHDFAIFREAIAIQTALLFDLTPPNWDAWRRWSTFLSKPIDVQTLSDTIKLGDTLLKLSPSRFASNDKAIVRSAHEFKARVRHEGLYWSFISPMENWIDEWYTTSSIDAFRYLSQWLNLMSHLRLVDIDLQTSLLAEYLEQENVETSWVYDPELISSMNSIMKEWTKTLKFEDPRPSNGPGAAAETRRTQSRLAKYSSFATDDRLFYFLRRVYPSGEYYLPDLPIPHTLKRVSELVFVPKSMTKNRTISKEPAILQYYQHAAWSQINCWLQKDIFLRTIIDLSRQDLSQDLARRGSIDGSYATLDLSAASDTVTLRLAKGLFTNTSLYLPEICLRSDMTRLPNGKLLALNKLAPMGSDLCFPTECLVFACVCEYAVRVVSGHKSRLNDYRVYGDDIVVRQRFSQKVEEVLTSLHFRVNETKSFMDVDGHNFREACGGEYLDGYSVNPVRISRRFNVCLSPQEDPILSSVEDVSSWVELSNRFFTRGMSHVRRWIIHRLGQLFDRARFLPYTTGYTDTSGVWIRDDWHVPTSSSTTLKTYEWCCTNFHLRRRKPGIWGCDGSTAIEAIVPCGKTARDSTKYPNIDSEMIRWLEYWTRAAIPRMDTASGIFFAPEAIRSIDPVRQSWRKKWIAT